MGLIMSSQIDYTQEPEKIWKASLLKHQNEAYYFLFIATDQLSKSWEILIGWIATLNEASQNNLSHITTKLEKSIFNTPKLSVIETYQIFRDVSKHVYSCYLSQSGFGMVQTSTLPPKEGGPKPPEKKAYVEVSAKLK